AALARSFRPGRPGCSRRPARALRAAPVLCSGRVGIPAGLWWRASPGARPDRGSCPGGSPAAARRSGRRRRSRWCPAGTGGRATRSAGRTARPARPRGARRRPWRVPPRRPPGCRTPAQHRGRNPYLRTWRCLAYRYLTDLRVLHRQHRPPGQVRGRGHPTPFHTAGGWSMRPNGPSGRAVRRRRPAVMVRGVGTAAVTAAGEMHGFPAALASFIGRAGARRDVAGLVEECRLVTVTGPGGVGKTRLAGQVARLVAGRFADGAWLAELAPVRDPAQVAAVVAAALGIREQPGTPVAGALARVLAGQQLLLVLDNCEHVIGGAAELCAGLLAACDDVRVLATSREPLAVAGEARYRLGPLTLPAPGDTADGGRSEAVALFADRARRVDAGFALDGENGPVVGLLVARLDGMPLAIELAAARVEALGVAGLLDRIGDRFALLTGGDRLAADRQRSLAATVEWSYRLLEEHERRVFRQ